MQSISDQLVTIHTTVVRSGLPCADDWAVNKLFTGTQYWVLLSLDNGSSKPQRD